MDPESPDFVPSLFTCSKQSRYMRIERRVDRKRMGADANSRSSLAHASSPVTEAQRSSTVEPATNCPEGLCLNTQPVCEEVLPSLQQCEIKVEEIPVLVAHPQIKEEQVDQSISPDMEADTSYDAEVKSEPTTNYEPVSTSAAVTVSVNENIKEEWNEDDASSSPLQSDGVDVFVELEQPPREEKLCRFCDKRFKRDSHLIRHVDKSHKGQKAFKCLECNKEFEQRYQLVLHIRIHTGEKPFSCDFCGKTFTQNSSRIVHMRQHTGEKPYFCKKCRKRFASSHHLKLCTGTKNKSTKKSFRCTTCGRTFHTESDLKVHTEVHESWKRHISKKLEEQTLEEEQLEAV